MKVWRVQTLLTLALLAALSACGRTGIVGPAATFRSPPATACVERPLPPNGVRMTVARDESVANAQLAVVPASTQPKVTAARAFAALGYVTFASTCGVTEELADWSSDTPATLPTGCPGTDLARVNSTYCRTTPSKPLYQHVLAWVFTWHTDCMPVSGPPPAPGQTAAPQVFPPPLSCTAIAFVDANTGQRSDLTAERSR